MSPPFNVAEDHTARRFSSNRDCCGTVTKSEPRDCNSAMEFSQGGSHDEDEVV
jgi:hypothetical protein